MDKIRLGRTELYVSKTSFGALPVQRIGTEDAVKLLRYAFEQGINYFDTANMYTDSEEKIGQALHDVREQIILSTKSTATDKAGTMAHIQESLRRMKTDYIDLFQFHNPAVLPDINDPDGAFAAVLEAKEKGYIRHVGITNHRLSVAQEAIASGHFETLQFPFSYIASAEELDLVNQCKEQDMGFIAMKGLCGGLLNNAKACYAFMQQYPTVVPIWGIQHQWELEQWLALDKEVGTMTEEIQAIIQGDRKELAGNFCRSCGYCLPCPMDIDIPQSARMSALLRRAPYQPYMSQQWQEKMHRIEDCIGCGDCKIRCPYGLDIPNLLKTMLKDYTQFTVDHKGE